MSQSHVGDHRSLQDTSVSAAASPAAVELTTTVLTGGITLDAAIEIAASHFVTEPRVDVVVAALTNFTPEDESLWKRLGERAWIREWTSPDSHISIVPAGGAGAETALTMPWLSPLARIDMVALTDCELLPDEAEQDRRELTALGLRSIVGSTLIARGEMFGSMSVCSASAGSWPAVLIADLRLLKAAITSRIVLEHSRRSLAEAIEAGTEAQMAYQQFFGAVGHELRTPLASILGYTEVLLDDAEHASAEVVSAGMLRDGPVILRACEQLVGMVDNLLGAGRTLSGDDHRQGVVIADALADVVHWHRTPAQTAGVRTCVDVDPTATAWAHASGVREVLANLLGNAIAHHHPTGGTVHLTTEQLLGESGQPMVRIIVRDDGPGLDAEQLQHVFEPFVRYAEAGTKGSGLGLSISRTIAERDGGAVRGESTPGVGSSFWLELPAFVPPVA